MNIFILDNDPVLAAQWQCDKHVVKMILESTQLLSTAHWLNASKGPYKPTHAHHPCTKWVSESRENYLWLCEHAHALLEEYKARYGKEHACKQHIVWLSANVPNEMRSLGQTSFAIAMNMQQYGHCLVPNDPVRSYRNYYKAAKAAIATWKRNKPPWW